MPLLLCRIDDRLIHGQVVVGWGRPLGIELIVLVDDEVRASDWEQDLYRMGVPAGRRGALRQRGRGRRRPSRSGSRISGAACCSPPTSTRWLALRQAHSSVQPVNLGGLHHRPGRSERLPYVYLTTMSSSSSG